MKYALLLLKALLALFLVICVSVHVYGIFVSATTEPLWSHIVHIISYVICLAAFLFRIKFRMHLYLLGMLYPFFYHARCAWIHFAAHHTLHPICMLVIVMLPLAGLMVRYESKD
jgi:hypothetical protein